MEPYDFSGWATRNDLKCSDGRTIRRDAFKHHDGQTVPLVWMHQHNDPNNILGHALLQNRPQGVYAYCYFNDTESGRNARELVKHGDVSALSIYANRLKQKGGDVLHGDIKEVSLVVAGANPGAFIDSVIAHSEDADSADAIIFTGDEIELYHADEEKEDEKKEGEPEVSELKHEDEKKDERTVKDVFDTLTEEQKTVVYAIIGQALEEKGTDDDDDEGGNKDMKHNLFDNEMYSEDVLTHADQENIIAMAKSSSVGSLQNAIGIYAEQNDMLKHGFDEETINELFPEYKDVRPGAPEMITRDLSWVDHVMRKVHKSPISRIRTRQMDVRSKDLRALGYNNREIAKKNGGVPALLKRTTDPQTVYRKDALHRDDIIDITDFDVVEYQYRIMKDNLSEDIAMAILIGDGRDDADEDKIHENHIRSIYNDEELYCMHYDVDVEGMRKKLQGTNTDAYFGEEYIYAEAIISAALYSREKYKGSGALEFYCTPHLLNIMLLARDMNGRRIYSSKADLQAALNVTAIHTVEQFEGKTRTTKEGETKKLLGLFVNLSDYYVGSTKGGEITRFNQFDIDFNQEKYLIETRLSGALTKVMSAIALEEPVSAASGEEEAAA